MEIPEYNPEVTPRIKNAEYWPFAKFIPVLSETALQILYEKGAVKLEKDLDGEEIMRIIINNKFYDLPRILTSKRTLSWLGFTKERVDELWESLVKVSPPMVTPSISDGGAWAFWQEIKLWIGDEMYAITERSTDKKDDVWNNKVLSRIGFDHGHRFKSLKIKGENGLMYTRIQDQKPQDLLPLVQRYVHHRWHMLVELNKMILPHSSSYFYSSAPGGIYDDGLAWLAVEFEKGQFDVDPVDLDTMYNHKVTWRRVEWCTPPK